MILSSFIVLLKKGIKMKLTQEEKDLVAGGNRKEFIKLQKQKYDKLIEAENIARELETRIAVIKAIVMNTLCFI